jgi:hypothetical protein
MVYPSIYLQLNNLNDSDESIKQVKEYLRKSNLPGSLDNSSKKKRFLAKWEKDFKIENDKLVYSPLNLIVIPDDKRNDVLKKYTKILLKVRLKEFINFMQESEINT